MAIYQRRDGWEVRVYAGVDPLTGKPHRISRQVRGSHKQAEREETRLKAEVMAGRHRGTAAKTFGEMVEVYLEWREHNGKPIGPHTIRSYRGLYEARIKPGIGKLRLPQIDPPTPGSLLHRTAQERQPPQARSAAVGQQAPGHACGHLRRSGARCALRLGHLQPGHPRQAPAPQSAKRALPTREQARAALQAAGQEDPELYLFLRLEATTGLRPGELCALWWQDLDLEAGEVVVGHNVVHEKGLPGGFVRKRTKSRHGDDRPLALDDRTVALLKDHRTRREARAREWGGELAGDAYVFSVDEAGRRPLRVDSVTRRFGELARRLGHGYTLYGFRHFMATQLGAVATTATIRERMGHGSLAVTGIYVHQVSEADRVAARHMGNLLDGAHE